MRKPQKPKRDEQAELERMIADVCKENGGKPLVDTKAAVPLEDFPATEPSKEDRAKRKELHRLAKEALVLSKDMNPLCVAALKALASFAAGKAGYLDLVIARQRMSNRVTSAGVVGIRHECANAASTLACCCACSPDINDAERLTRKYCALTAEFSKKSRAKKKGTKE
jgi:hypothetical protein